MKTHTRRTTGVFHAVPAVGMAILCLFPLAARAGTLYWDFGGTPDTLWSNAVNWDTAAGGGGGNPGSAPGASDTAVFNVSTLNSLQTATLNGTLAVQGIVFGSTGQTKVLTDGVALRLITLGSGGITINAGAGAVTLGVASPVASRLAYSLSAPQTWQNNSANVLSFSNNHNVDLGASVLTVDGSGVIATGSGDFSGTGGLVKNGTGSLTLAGDNVFTGGVTLNSGTLVLGSGTSLGGAESVLTITGGGLASGVAGLTLTTAYAQYWNGDFAFSGANSLNLGAGAVTLGGNRTVSVNSSALTVGGVIGGSGFCLTKVGAGTLGLSGSNTYDGGSAVCEGALQFNTAGAISGSGRNVMVHYGATAAAGYAIDQSFLGRINTASAGTVALAADSGNSLDFSAAGLANDVSLGAVGTATYSGSLTPYDTTTYRLGGGGGNLVISNAGALNGARSLIAFGSGSGGTLTLAAAQTYSAGSTVNGGGTLQLDFSTASAPAANIIASGTALALNGGTLVSKGVGATKSNSQTFSSVTIGEGVSKVYNQPNGSVTSTLNLGTLVAETAGGSLLITNGTSGVVTTTSANDAAGILSGRIVYGSGTPGFASRASNGSIGANTTVAAWSATLASGATNYAITVNTTTHYLSVAGAVNSLRIAIMNNNDRFFNLGGFLLTNLSGGLLFTSTGNHTISTGTMTAGSGVNELIFYHYSAKDLNNNATMVNNGNAVAVSLVGTGTGRMVVGGNNTYSGGTFINGGTTLRANHASALGTGIVKLNGGTLQLAQALSVNNNLSGLGGSIIDLGANTLTVTQDGDSAFAGSIINTGVVVKAGTGALTLSGANTYAGGTTVDAGALLVCNVSGSGTGTNAVTVTDDATLGGTGLIAGAVTVANGGALAPGLPDEAGTLTVRNLTLSASSTFAVDLASDTSADRVVATGSVALGGELVVTPVDGYVPDAGASWTILEGPIASGEFESVASGYEVDVGASSVVLRFVGGGKGTILLVR